MTRPGPEMLLLLTIIGSLMAAISGQIFPTFPVFSENLKNVHSTGNSMSEFGKKPVLLVNGTSHCSGTVKVKIWGSWQLVCEDFWSKSASLAVCRELHCEGMEPVASDGTPDPETSEHLTVGNRSTVLNETRGTHLTVLCDQGRWESCQVQSSVCASGRSMKVNCEEVHSVRLVDGGNRCAGRVELKDKGTWGTVCDDSWDLQDAEVVCQQLGCGRAIHAPEASYFQKGKGPIYLDEVNCSGSELSLWECPAQRNHDCGHKEDASVICSGSLSSNTSLIPNDSSSPQLPTTAPSVSIGMQKKEPQDQVLLILCIILGILLLVSLITLAFVFLKDKGKYALPPIENHDQRTSTATLGGNNSYHDVSITIPKEEAPKLSLQVGAPSSKDSESDSDYERYDFHTQPPVPLSTFYNSQKHRVTEEMAQQSRFRMPPLQEDHPVPAPQNYQRYNNSESSTSSGEDYCNTPTSKLPPANSLGFSSERNHLVHTPNTELAGSRATLLAAPVMAPQNYQRHNSESSTSSGEDYCNSPTSKLPQSNFQGFSSEKNLLEQSPNLKLAGSQATVPGTQTAVASSGPAAEDSSSTSSGEWYENFGSTQAPLVKSLGWPETPAPAVTGGYEDDSSSDDYDDIGAA